MLTVSVSPIIEINYEVKAVSNARVSSHLVETISGMETVKGQGMELQSEWQWEKFYGREIKAGFQNTITSSGAGAANIFATIFKFNRYLGWGINCLRGENDFRTIDSI